MKLGSFLASIAREAGGLMDEERALFEARVHQVSGSCGELRMIFVATNVISEPPRREPNVHVFDWIDAQALETFYLSAITVAELNVINPWDAASMKALKNNKQTCQA